MPDYQNDDEKGNLNFLTCIANMNSFWYGMCSLVEEEEIVVLTRQLGTLDLIREAAGEDWGVQGGDRTGLVLHFINRATTTISGVVGELDPDIFRSGKILEYLHAKLTRGVVLDFTFCLNDLHSHTQAREYLERESPLLFALWKQFPTTLILRWSTHWAAFHFFVADNANSFTEDPAHPRAAIPATIVRYDDTKWAREWVNRYTQEVIPHSQILSAK